MEVMNISPISYKAAKTLKMKQLNIPLKNDMTAVLKISDKELNCAYIRNSAKANEMKQIGGFTKKKSNGVTSSDIWAIYERLQNNVKEGFDFFEEFTKAIFTDSRGKKVS